MPKSSIDELLKWKPRIEELAEAYPQAVWQHGQAEPPPIREAAAEHLRGYERDLAALRRAVLDSPLPVAEVAMMTTELASAEAARSNPGRVVVQLRFLAYQLGLIDSQREAATAAAAEPEPQEAPGRESLDHGPVAPRAFRYAGELHEVPGQNTWPILNVLWERGTRAGNTLSVAEQDVIDAVWPEAVVESNTLYQAVHKVREFLREIGAVGYQLYQRDGCLHLECPPT